MPLRYRSELDITGVAEARASGLTTAEAGTTAQMTLPRLLRASESVDRIDDVAEALAHRLRRLLRNDIVDKTLRGAWIGHPAHPLLVTVPIGAWVCSAVFDLLGDRRAARRLVALGILTAPAAVVTGLAEFSRLSTVQRRVGLLHLLANLAAEACYLSSHRCRTRGSHGAGTLWSVLGLAAVATGGALGGHLSYALGAGVYEWQEGSEH